MKVIDRAVISDGTEIQLEDWSESNTEEFLNLYGLTIAVYSVAQRTVKKI